MNILEGIAKIVKSVLFISSKLFNCKLYFLHGMIEDTVIIIMVIMNLTMHFQMGKWRFSVWVNMTFLTYLTWIVRCESDMRERSGGVLLCCEETGAKQ